MQTVIVSLPSFNLCVKVLTYREYTSEKSAKHTDNKEYEPDDERVVVDAYDLYDRAEHVRRRVNCGAVKTVKDGACNRCGYNAVYCALQNERRENKDVGRSYVLHYDYIVAS